MTELRELLSVRVDSKTKDLVLLVAEKKGEADVVQGSILAVQARDGGQTDPSAPLLLVQIITKEQRTLANKLITEHHSYVKSIITVGRRIDYLVYKGKSLIGCIGVNSAPLPMSKVAVDYFAPFAGGRILRPIFNSIGNNWKFTLTPEAPKNTGSRVLSLFAHLAQRDWKTKYGDDLKWLITFVGAGKEGTIYKAAGWTYLGQTANTWHGGFSKIAPVSVEKKKNTGIKKIFVKRLS